MAAMAAAGGLDDHRVGSGVGATACAPGGGVELRFSGIHPLEMTSGSSVLHDLALRDVSIGSNIQLFALPKQYNHVMFVSALQGSSERGG